MASRKQLSRGFTLIELMIVISLILILVSISIPAYNRSILHAKEGVLRQNLFTMRSLISQYTLDKQKAPEALDDLVTAGYIKQIPVDPFTGRNDSWRSTRKTTHFPSTRRTPAALKTFTAARAKSRLMARRTARGDVALSSFAKRTTSAPSFPSRHIDRFQPIN